MNILFELGSSGSVVEFFTRDWGAAGSSTGVTELCPWARHIYPSIVLVQTRKTNPCLTERLLMGRKESNQTNIWILQVNNIARPSAYESAIRSKERAREDIQVGSEVFQMSRRVRGIPNELIYSEVFLDVMCTKKPVHGHSLASVFVFSLTANYYI